MRYNLVLTLWLRASLGSAYARGKLMALQRRQKEQKHIRIHMLNEQRWCLFHSLKSYNNYTTVQLGLQYSSQ